MKRIIIPLFTFILGIISTLIVFYVTNNNFYWKNKFQVSDVKIENDYYVFDVNNLTKNDYYIDIWFSATNGDITLNDACLFNKIEGNQVKHFECPTTNAINDTYKVKIKQININD